MEKLTVVDDIFTLCFASTATTVSIGKEARTEYESGSTIDGYEKK